MTKFWSNQVCQRQCDYQCYRPGCGIPKDDFSRIFENITRLIIIRTRTPLAWGWVYILPNKIVKRMGIGCCGKQIECRKQVHRRIPVNKPNNLHGYFSITIFVILGETGELFVKAQRRCVSISNRDLAGFGNLPGLLIEWSDFVLFGAQGCYEE
jgi:hypothetical protein